jgi:hypothetical protein
MLQLVGMGLGTPDGFHGPPAGIYISYKKNTNLPISERSGGNKMEH